MTSQTWVPSRDEAAIIRKTAIAYGGVGCTVEIGERCATEGPERYSTNILLVTDDPDWAGSDLNQHWSWQEFRRGVPLTDDGRAVVDFYIYSHNEEIGLCTNIQAIVEDGRLVRIDETMRQGVWRAA